MLEKNNKLAGGLITVAGGICWGISGCFGQYIFESTDVNAEWLVSIRLVSAGLLLLSLGILKDGAARTLSIFKNRKDTKDFLIFALFGMLICQYAFFGTIERSNAATATVLQSVSPVLILIMVCISRRSAPKLLECVSIAGCLAGSFLICTHGDLSGMQLSTGALVYGMGAALGGASYTVLSGPLLRKYSTWTVVGGGMLVSGILMCAFVRPWEKQVEWSAPFVAAMAGVIIIGTAVAFSLFLKGASMVGPMTASVLANSEPMTSIIISATLLGSRFMPADIAGFALTLGAVALLSYSQNRDKKAAVQ